MQKLWDYLSRWVKNNWLLLVTVDFCIYNLSAKSNPDTEANIKHIYMQKRPTIILSLSYLLKSNLDYDLRKRVKQWIMCMDYADAAFL